MTNGLVLGVNVLTGVVTARVLGPEGRGEFAAITLWPPLLGWAFAFALPSALVYHAKKDPQRRRATVGMAMMLSAIGGLLAFSVGEALLPQLLRHASPGILREARWMMTFAATTTVATVLTALLQLEERFRLYNRARYAPLLLTLIALLVLAFLGALTPFTAALAYLLPGVPVFFFLAWWALWRVRPTARDASGSLRPLLSYSVRAYGGEAAGTLLAQLDKVFLVNLLMPASYGVYVVVFNLSRIITALSAAAAPVLLPRSAGRCAADVARMTGQVLRVALPLMLLAAAAFVLAGGQLLRWLYGPQFASGEWALSGLVLESVISSVTYIITQPYLALNRPGVITVIQATSLPVLALAMAILVPRWGIDGAALGLLVSTLYRALATYCGFKGLLRVPAPRLWPDLKESRDLVRRLRAAL